MPIFHKLNELLKNSKIRAAFGVLLLLCIGLPLWHAIAHWSDSAQDRSPVLLGRDIGEITGLSSQRQRLEYLLIAKPLAEFPRYVIKYRDDPRLHVVKVPSQTHLNIEREVLLKNTIPYAFAKTEFIDAHQAIFKDDEEKMQAWATLGDVLARNAVGIALLLALVFVLKNGLPGVNSKANVLQPEQLRGSMDDLIGMEDIKQEVAHLQEMIVNRGLYRSHNIDKPFNVMLTGPAGTGKTKLVGYLAKQLNMPLIQASGSSLESGFVGGGSKALTALHAKACKLGDCIVFLDEAQTLFMPRGRGDKKWEDDTANTLLGLLDGVSSQQAKGVIWVVASNFDEVNSAMDDAMLRRFSVKINFRLPNKTERRALLEVLLGKKAEGCVNWDDLDLNHAAEVTGNLSPALLETVVDRASLIAIQEKTIINTDLLIRAFERATIGLTDRATSAEKLKQRERVAVHELGHFFMQIDPLLKQGLPLANIKEQSKLLKISTESVSKLGALGFVLSSSDDAGLHTLEELEQEVVNLYGGVAAEELFYGERGISEGSLNDIQKATKQLNMMVNRLSMYSRAKLDYSQLHKEGGQQATLPHLEAKADELYQRTLEAMQCHRGKIESIKTILLDRYVLSKEDVFALLEEME